MNQQKQLDYLARRVHQYALPDVCMVETVGSPTMTPDGILTHAATLRLYKGSPIVPCRLDNSRSFRPETFPNQEIIANEYVLHYPIDFDIKPNDKIYVTDTNGDVHIFEMRKKAALSNWRVINQALIVELEGQKPSLTVRSYLSRSLLIGLIPSLSLLYDPTVVLGQAPPQEMLFEFLARGGSLYDPSVTMGAFDPASVGALQIWYDFDDLSTLYQNGGLTNPVTSDGQFVEEVFDKSGNGMKTVQPNGAALPTTRWDIQNGRNVLRFDGVGDRYNLPDLSTLTAGEAFIALRVEAYPPAASQQTGLWHFGTAAPKSAYSLVGGGIMDSFGTADNRYNQLVPYRSLAQWNVYNAASGANYWQNWLNETSLITHTSNTVGFPTAPRLAASVGSSEFVHGDIGEFLLFSEVLTPEARSKVKAYLYHKWGITP